MYSSSYILLLIILASYYSSSDYSFFLEYSSSYYSSLLFFFLGFWEFCLSSYYPYQYSPPSYHHLQYISPQYLKSSSHPNLLSPFGSLNGPIPTLLASRQVPCLSLWSHQPQILREMPGVYATHLVTTTHPSPPFSLTSPPPPSSFPHLPLPSLLFPLTSSHPHLTPLLLTSSLLLPPPFL